MKRIKQKDLIDYEISSSWLMDYVWFDKGKIWLAKYFARKTIRKYRRYLYAIENRNGNI